MLKTYFFNALAIVLSVKASSMSGRNNSENNPLQPATNTKSSNTMPESLIWSSSQHFITFSTYHLHNPAQFSLGSIPKLFNRTVIVVGPQKVGWAWVWNCSINLKNEAPKPSLMLSISIWFDLLEPKGIPNFGRILL